MMSLPQHLLCGLLVVAIVWFIIMLSYMDDLLKHGDTPHRHRYQGQGHIQLGQGHKQLGQGGRMGYHHYIPISDSLIVLNQGNNMRDISTKRRRTKLRKQEDLITSNRASSSKGFVINKDSSKPLKEGQVPFRIKHRFKREKFTNISDKFIYKKYTIRPVTKSLNRTITVEQVNQNISGSQMITNQTKDDLLDIENDQSRHSFNVSASNMISLDRVVPDFRPKHCPSIYPPTELTVSVIICFHNEAWSALLRTVHSVLHTSPAAMLAEIILVDDASTYDYLGQRLESTVSSLGPVFLYRTMKREGLIRSRLHGVSKASGDIVVFLDSHCECAKHWLEPMVEAIKLNKKQIVCPEIDIIRDTSFAYEHAPEDLHGGFEWNMQFVWKPIPRHEKLRRQKESDPIRSPTMIGGLFAVDRDYFTDIGMYDPHMDIWGGENVELSFRVWMCGGSIHILPCSRVGHVFRSVIPYSFPGGAKATLTHNAVRVAETWMDDYKRFFYATSNLDQSADASNEVMDRIMLRKKLHCSDFSWYLSNVVPEMLIPREDAVYFGQIHHGSVCVDSGGHGLGTSLKLATCVTQHINQMFYINKSGHFLHRNLCVDENMHLNLCMKVRAKWTFSDNNQLSLHLPGSSASQCASVTSSKQITVIGCSKTQTEAQKWKFTHNFRPAILKKFLS